MSSVQGDFSALLDAFERSDWQEMTVEIGGARLSVSRRGESSVGPPPGSAAADSGLPAALLAEAPAPVTPADPVPQEALPTLASPVHRGLAVTSPSVGIFWLAPSPVSPPFVEVGSIVDAEDTIGLVEVMKLMQQVSAGVSGAVTGVVVGNGETVEYGQPLVYIDPAAG
jgi:acetyl-CoA carboxylase biotin carboxyl carrier protein